MNEEIKRFPEALRYVGKLIYERGWDYYKQNKITLFRFENNSIQARVRGSSAEEYDVTVRLENDIVTASHCSCPYWARCKHIAAVVIYYFDNASGKMPTDPEHPLPAPESYPERTIHLNFNIRQNVRVKDFLRFVSEVASPAASTDERTYKIVFRLKKKVFSYVTPVWHITPSVQLIKKDGTAGSVYGYSPEKRLAPHSPAEAALLKKLTSVQEKSESLDYHIDTVIEHPEIDLFVLYEYKYVLLIRRMMTKTRVSFELHRIERDTPVFRPEFLFCSEAGDLPAAVRNDDYSIIRYGEWLVCLTNNGYLYYCRDAEVLSTMIRGLRDITDYSAADIKLVKEFIERNDIKNIEAVFNVRSITIGSPAPANILEVERRFLGMLAMRLVFDYNGTEVQYGGKDAIISKNGDRQTITVIHRNTSLEQQIFEALTLLIGDQSSSNYSFLERGTGSFVIGQDLNTFLSGYGIAFMEKGFTLRIGKEKKLSGKTGRMSLRIKTGIDWFDVSLAYLDNEGNELPISIDAQDAFRGLVKTAGSYMLLDKEDLVKMRELLSQGMGQTGTMRVSRYNLGFIDEFYDSFVNKGDSEIARIRELYERLNNAGKLEDYPLPNAFGGVLRDYQRAGYNWLHFLRQSSLNGCLADDMGLGKTVQTLALLKKLKEEGNLGLSLLVVPVTTFVNWENEIERFSPGISHLRHAGPLRAKTSGEIQGVDVVIVSYQTLRNDHSLFSGIQFDYLILDESQNIKNAYTKAYKAIRSIHARNKLSLTGTPVENSSIELWALMEVLNPGLLRSIDDFRRRFARPIQEASDHDAASKLRKIVGPFILRRKKEDVLRELPEKEIINLYVELGSLQRHAYDEVKYAFRDRITNKISSEGIKKSHVLVLEGLLRLRQMTLFPTLVSEDYGKIESAKFELLKEMIDDILSEDHKILVYSQFVNVLKIIETHVKELECEYVYLDGSTRGRAQVIDKFQKDKSTRIFLLSLKAGGIGINLTSADYVILFDPWWNPAIEAQAIGRAHRIGQERKVIGYKIIAKDTVEEKILTLQEKKQRIVQDIIAEDNSVFKYLDAKEIIGLFN